MKTIEGNSIPRILEGTREAVAPSFGRAVRAWTAQVRHLGGGDWRPLLRWLAWSVTLLALTGAMARDAAMPALAAGVAAPLPGLEAVITNIRNWVMGIAFTFTTLYLTWAGVRYIFAGHSPHAMEEAKIAVRNCLLGYGLVVLAPMLAGIAKGVVGA